VVRADNPPVKMFSIQTSRPGSRNGRGRSMTAWTTLNMAVQAPMPKARVSMATAAKPGFLNSWRRANFRSFMARSFHS
jgi:hypothetical protein